MDRIKPDLRRGTGRDNATNGAAWSTAFCCNASPTPLSLAVSSRSWMSAEVRVVWPNPPCSAISDKGDSKDDHRRPHQSSCSPAPELTPLNASVSVTVSVIRRAGSRSAKRAKTKSKSHSSTAASSVSPRSTRCAGRNSRA